MLSKQLRQKWKEEFSKEWFQFIMDHSERPISYCYLSLNRNVTIDIVKNNPQIEWNYYFLSENPNITWEIVQNNPQIPWDYGTLSRNTNITWEIILNNPQIKWNYRALSYNRMTKGFNDYMEKKEELYNTAYKIIDRYTNRDIAEMIMSI